MDNLEGNELIVGRVYAGDEEERGVAPVDYFGVCWVAKLVNWRQELGYEGKNITFVFEEIAHACSTSKDELRDILDDFGFVLRREGGEPLCETLVGALDVCLWRRSGKHIRLYPGGRAGTDIFTGLVRSSLSAWEQIYT